MCKCKRCGRKLISKESVERGYGRTCYRIHLLQKEKQTATKVEDDVAFLKMEIKMLKNQIKTLKITGVKSTEAIERIKKDHEEKEATDEDRLKGLICRELKSIFSDPDWRSKILHSPDEMNEIREPPK